MNLTQTFFNIHVVEIGTVCNFCDNNPHKRGWTYEKSMLIKKHVHNFYKIRHDRLTIFTKNMTTAGNGNGCLF